MNVIDTIEAEGLKEGLTDFRAGDRVKVHVRVREGEKSRTQIFEGDVIARRGGVGLRATFTVRKSSGGIGVERVFPLHSPNIAKIERIRAGQVRRKKLYYLRELTGKSARIKEQITDLEKGNNSKTSKDQAEPETGEESSEEKE